MQHSCSKLAWTAQAYAVIVCGVAVTPSLAAQPAASGGASQLRAAQPTAATAPSQEASQLRAAQPAAATAPSATPDSTAPDSTAPNRAVSNSSAPTPPISAPSTSIAPATASTLPPATPTASTPAPASAPPLDASGAAAAADAELVRIAKQLDDILQDAARDLGLSDDAVRATQLDSSPAAVEDELYAAPGAAWVIVPTVTRAKDGWVLRLCARRGSAGALLVARSELDESNLEVRAIQALRSLTHDSQNANPSPPKVKPATPVASFSDGQAVLAANGALAGGYFGFSLEHIGGGSDARLLYPVIALGAGIGVGASFVIAGEWDISTPEAWYIAAASTWPTLGALLVASTQDIRTHEDRFAYGLLGTGVGLTLGAFALNYGEVHEGGSLLTHSGAFFGGFMGALAQRWIEPQNSGRPAFGIGVGLTGGTLIAGFAATQLPHISAPRVLFIDLGGTLGALAGAAVASPFVLGRELDTLENRVWVGSIGLGAVVGACLGAWITTEDTHARLTSPAWYTAWSPEIRAIPFGDTKRSMGWTLGMRRAW